MNPAETPPAAPQKTPQEEQPARRNQAIKRILFSIALAAALVFAAKAWLHARAWVSTDDAFLAAHIERVSSRVAGRVAAVPVTDNQPVKAGQILVELEDDDFNVALHRAEAGLASAKAEVAKAEAQRMAAEAAALQAAASLESSRAEAENARLELDRNERLRESGTVAQQSLDTARKNEQTTSANVVASEKQVSALQAGVTYTIAALEAAKASVAKAGAEVEKAKLDLSYTKISAKQNGRVTVKSVEPGNYVQPGQALLAVVSPDVWVEANLKENQLRRVRPGQEVRVRVDAYPDLDLRGHVDSIQAGSGAKFSLLPPENATGNYVKVVQRVPVKITLDLPASDLPLLGPGMSVVPEIRVH